MIAYVFHSDKNRKDSLETRAVLLIMFAWNLDIRGGCAENAWLLWSFYKELLTENDFEAVLANFCCYGYRANVSSCFLWLCVFQKYPEIFAI